MAGSAKAVAASAADKMRAAMGSARDTVKQRIEVAQLHVAEASSVAARDFAKRNPKLAQSASTKAMGYATGNPGAAAAAGQVGSKAALGLMWKNPQMAMSTLKVSARAAAMKC